MSWRSKSFGALRHPDEPRLLFLRSDRDWGLPRVVGRRLWIANAEMIVPAFERRLGTKPWLLRQLHFEEHEEAKRFEAVFELALRDTAWRPPANGRWIGRTDLDGLRLRDEDQRGLLAAYLDARVRNEVPEQRVPWACPGWVDEVRGWLEHELARLGHSLLGIEQRKQWSISSVLCVRTSGPDLYFKVSAPLPLFVEEASVTAMLAERFPGYVPAPLAIEPQRGWFLLPEFDDLIGWQPPLEVHEELFRRYAGLQRRSADLTVELLADGCLDRRLHVLETQVDPLLDDPEAIEHLTPEEIVELRRLGPTLKEACRRLAACGLPDTLVHGDLHPGNVARMNGKLAYFDWTDACIAHPFIDLHSLQWQQDEATRGALLKAYLGAWEGVESHERLHEAAALARIVTPLHHAVSYQHIVVSLEPAAKPELDATHQFLREVLAHAGAWPLG